MTKDNWEILESAYKLTSSQLEAFKTYASLLQEWSELFNLTTITSERGIIKRHFIDSLMLGTFVDLNKLKLIVDVGSGAGLPGIPLKIAYPNLKVILLEVSKKKQNFLNTVIKELGLDGIEVCDLDFRTFIRNTEAPVDMFVSRASLDPVELCRIFKPACEYKKAKLVYWSSGEFEIDKKVSNLILDEHHYKDGQKKRKLILFENKN